MRHHIQKTILYTLAFRESAKFSELQPAGVENKLFDYHLKQLIADKLVQKDQAGLYTLTARGRKQGVSIFENEDSKAERARSVLFLIVRDCTGKWLLYRRHTHPLIHLVGYMHATPKPTETVFETATRELREQTDLIGSFRFCGSGFFKTEKQGELESYTHFALLACDDATGQLQQLSERAEYFWLENLDFASEEMLPNMKMLTELYEKGETFFIEHTFQV